MSTVPQMCSKYLCYSHIIAFENHRACRIHIKIVLIDTKTFLQHRCFITVNLNTNLQKFRKHVVLQRQLRVINGSECRVRVADGGRGHNSHLS